MLSSTGETKLPSLIEILQHNCNDSLTIVMAAFKEVKRDGADIV